MLLHNAQVGLFYFLAGAGVPEEAAAGARRQVCVRGESVHHRGQLQLLRRGGLSRRGQGAGRFAVARFPLCTAVCVDLSSHLTAGLNCFGFLPQHL